MLTDKSYNYEYTWKLLDSYYSLNMNFYQSFANVINITINFYKLKISLVFGSAFNLIKYSLEGLLPYDLNKIEEILKMQSKVNNHLTKC